MLLEHVEEIEGIISFVSQALNSRRDKRADELPIVSERMSSIEVDEACSCWQKVPKC